MLLARLLSNVFYILSRGLLLELTQITTVHIERALVIETKAIAVQLLEVIRVDEVVLRLAELGHRRGFKACGSGLLFFGFPF